MIDCSIAYQRLHLLALLLLVLLAVADAQEASGGLELQLDEDGAGGLRVSLQLTHYDLRKHEAGYSLEVPGVNALPAPGAPALPLWTGLLLLPQEGSFRLVEREREEIPLGSLALCAVPASSSEKEAGPQRLQGWQSEPWPQQALWQEEPVFWLGRRVLPVSSALARVDEKGEVWVLSKLVFELEPGGDMEAATSGSRPRPSAALDRIVGASVLNPAMLRELCPPERFGRYLVVAPDAALPYLEDWLLAKRLQGWQMDLLSASELSQDGHPGWETIHARVQQEYESDGVDCLLLIGDIDRYENNSPWNLDAGFIEGGVYSESHWGSRCGSPFCIVSDHLLSLYEGEDYFADVLVGRWSVDNAQQLATLLARSLSYETERWPQIDSGWYNRALMIYDNAGAGSRRETKQAIRRQLLDFGFQQVDTLSNHYWENPLSPQLVTQAVNNGVSLINYRGYGQRTSWIGPMFSTYEINNDLSNVGRWPLVTSIVCGGGDFASVGADPCFGEAWLRAGEVSAPEGAVAFIGPSEENTHTRWNNCLDMGLYHGLVQENLRLMGALMERGKQEVYRCFPTERDWSEPGESVPFYYHCYNLLGDPGLELRLSDPQNLVADFTPPTLGQTNMRVQVSDEAGQALEGVRCCLLGTDSLLVAFAFSDNSGVAVLQFDPLVAGGHLLGLSAPDALPTQFAFHPVVAGSQPELLELLLVDEEDQQANPRDGLSLSPLLVERGDTGNADALLELVSLHDGLLVTQNLAELAGAAPGDTLEVSTPWQVQIASGLEHGTLLQMDVLLGGEWFARTSLRVQAPRLGVSYALLDGETPQPGMSGSLTLGLKNSGTRDLQEAWLRFSSLSAGLEVDNGLIGPFSVQAGDTSEILISNCSLSEDLVSGQVLDLRVSAWLEGEDDLGVAPLLDHVIQLGLGQAEEGDPLGPDAFGHLIYDNLDAGWSEVPLDEWIEASDSGDMLPIHDVSAMYTTDGVDGVSVLVDLPFAFPFWARSWERITVNSNGWIALGDQREYISGLNAPIPSAQGAPGLVAVMWTDLFNATYSNPFAEVFTYHDESRYAFVIQWDGFCYESTNITSSFQLQLLDPAVYSSDNGEGQMIVQYDQARDNLSALGVTIGIEDPEQSHGLQYAFAQEYPACAEPLANGLALWFTSSPLFEDVPEPGTVTQDWQLELRAYPNPANPVIRLGWEQPQVANAHWTLHDLRGALVTQGSPGLLSAGRHTVTIDASRLASGVYFATLRLKGGEGLAHRNSTKVIVMK